MRKCRHATCQEIDYYNFPSSSDWEVSSLVIAVKMGTFKFYFSGVTVSFMMLPVLCCIFRLTKTYTLKARICLFSNIILTEIDLLKFPKLPTLAKKEKRKKNIFLLYYVLEPWRAGMNENEKEWKKKLTTSVKFCSRFNLDICILHFFLQLIYNNYLIWKRKTKK